MKILLLFSFFLFFSCQKKSNKDKVPPLDPTRDIAIEDLFQSTGDDQADVVWLVTQGGPTSTLSEPNDLISFPNADYPSFASKFIKPNELLLVQVHQAFTYDSNFYKNFTLKKAQEVTDFSSAILSRVIKHFKDQGKTVWVFGHSYGCYMVIYQMWKKGNTAADKYIPMACRLDMEQETVEGWLSGRFWVYDDNFVPIEATKQATTLDEVSELKLGGFMFQIRFTEKLKGLQMSNVIFVVGSEDGSTGRLTQAEKDFLSSHSAELIVLEGGKHSSMFSH